MLMQPHVPLDYITQCMHMDAHCDLCPNELAIQTSPAEFVLGGKAILIWREPLAKLNGK